MSKKRLRRQRDAGNGRDWAWLTRAAALVRALAALVRALHELHPW